MKCIPCLALLGVLATSTMAVTEARGPGVTQRQLKALMYGDHLPGFHLTGSGSSLDVRDPRVAGGTRSVVAHGWSANDRQGALEIRCAVYASPKHAQAAFSDYVQESSGLVLERTPGGTSVGDAFRCNSPTTLAFFRVGRATVLINITPHQQGRIGKIAPYSATVETLVEGFAAGMEFNIRQQRELLAESDQTQRHQVLASGKPLKQTLPALTYRKVTWVPLSLFRSLGAQVKWDPRTGRATIVYRGRSIELRPFHSESRFGRKTYDLGAPMLLGQTGPVVPLRPIAKLLGLKVQTTASAITVRGNRLPLH